MPRTTRSPGSTGATPTPALTAFVGRLGAVRQAHPALTRAAWLTGHPFDETGLPDVEWRDAEGPMTSGEQWNAPYGDVLMAVFAAREGDALDRVAVAFNRGGAPASLRLPEARAGRAWRILIDTSDDESVDAATRARRPLHARRAHDG